MLIDGQLRHYDVVERHRIAVAASRDVAYRAIGETDFVRVLVPAARAVLDMRDVPAPIKLLARRIGRLAPDATFTPADALARGFVSLGERRGRAIALGAIGKPWLPHITLLPVDPAQFRAFQEPKYAKLAVAFWVEAFGPRKSVVRFEARIAATDDSARAHVRRWYRVVRPFTAFFLRRALASIKAEAEATAAGVAS